MEREVIRQKHPVLQMSTERRESTLPAGEYSQLSSKSEGTHRFSTISHFSHASCLSTFHRTSIYYKKSKGKKKQTKTTFPFILLINKDGVLPL